MIQYIFDEIDKHLKLDKPKVEGLARLGIYRVIDLLIYTPYDYKELKIFPDLTKLHHEEEVIIKVTVKEIKYPQKRSSPTKIYCANHTGGITVTYFNMHSYLKTIYRIGNVLTISGKVEFYDNFPQISHPDIIYDANLISSKEPKYALTYGLLNNQLRSYISKLLPLAEKTQEWLPKEIIDHYELPSFYEALKSIHSISNSNNSTKNSSTKSFLRLKIDEAFSNQLGFKFIQEKCIKEKDRIFPKDLELQSRILKKFPYSLTQGQLNAIKEIESDQIKNDQMLRMVQGDVGCGKTIVAFLASLNVLKSGGQVALMAPTEVLASQHFEFVSKYLDNTGYQTCLLSSKTKPKEREKLFASIKNGEIHYIVGTHSLLNEKLEFKDLAFVIVDEQHKFGVNQRIELVSKGNNPDVLIMSATPIPRTLSLTYFGDLSMTKITEMPSNRKKINTVVSSTTKLPDVFHLVSNKIKNNEKIYWICPLISQADNNEQENKANKDQIYIDVAQRYEYLQGLFGDKVGELHGALKQEKKHSIIEEFRNGEISILVSTTVVEVGVDVPDATLIVIENAEKFGLAQLHQLRGRVGRGSLDSSCILLYGKYTSKIAFERLKIMKESSDGFYIAEKDLLLRGEGELLGEKQSGAQNFRFVDLAADYEIIKACNKAVSNLTINQDLIQVISIFNKNIIDKKVVV